MSSKQMLRANHKVQIVCSPPLKTDISASDKAEQQHKASLDVSRCAARCTNLRSFQIKGHALSKM